MLELPHTVYHYDIVVNKRLVDPEEEPDSVDDLTKKVKVRRTVRFTREHLWNQMRKLNTMWKHLERGRLRRRTIATASMLLRGFVKIVEEAAPVLLENIESSSTPVGGEEKLAKLASKHILDKEECTVEISGDHEK